MKQLDRHKQGKVIRISGNTLQELDARRGELTYTQIIDKLLMASTTALYQTPQNKQQGGLRGLLRGIYLKIRFPQNLNRKIPPNQK